MQSKNIEGDVNNMDILRKHVVEYILHELKFRLEYALRITMVNRAKYDISSSIELQYSKMIDNPNFDILSYNKDGKAALYSAAMINMGVEPEDLVGLTFTVKPRPVPDQTFDFKVDKVYVDKAINKMSIVVSTHK